MKNITIVHLSDLHLGSDFVLRSLYRKRRWWKTEDWELIRNLEKAVREAKPDYVLVTGDVVNKCTKRNFDSAAQTLRQIFGNAGIDIRKQLLIIPGNHDVKVLPKEDEYFGRVLEFLRFLQSLFGEKRIAARKTRFVHLDVNRRICFFCLDSTLKEGQPGAEGNIGTEQLGWLDDKFKYLTETCTNFERFVKVVAMHHHPHPVERGGNERMMQLLDPDLIINAFRRLGTNLVLHGHKHFPHQRREFYAGNNHYVVAGAGTTSCPFVEEQAGEGNNFFVLNLEPTKNILEVQMMKADNNKEFVGHYPQPVRFPLFPPSVSGYRMAEFRSLNRIQDVTGSCLVTSQRVGILVDKPDFELRRLKFGFVVPEVAEITDFDYERNSVSGVEYETKTSHALKGYFLLNQPLKWGSDPIGLNSFTLRITKGFCMKSADYATFYPGKNSLQEGVELSIVHPCDQATITVEFPNSYRVQPRVSGEDFAGNSLDMKRVRHELKEDHLSNSFTLVIFEPIWQYTYSIVWQVP